VARDKIIVISAMQIAASIFACLLLIGCSQGDENANAPGTSSDQPDVKKVTTTYQDLRLMTKEPVYVDPVLAALCRGANQADVDAAHKISGPHAHTTVNIYMNDLAANVFGKPNPTYPVGSIIVKEKKGLDYRSTTQPGIWTKTNDGVGGMIKRPAGYDPQYGDWEYFYFENPSKIESGKINSCIQCHNGAADRDYVFGTWAGGTK